MGGAMGGGGTMGGDMGGEELCRRGECLQIPITISTHENLFTC